ncbi:MAG: DUF1592 domain-containing protein [Planctomycetaceae bacterium]
MRLTFLVLFSTALLFRPEHIGADDADRASNGLQVLYDFTETDGGSVKDRSQTGQPLNLNIADAGAVKRSDGKLQLMKSTVIRSQKPPEQLINAIRASGELSIEAWVEPQDTRQSGPARIVTLSGDANQRNFTIGQDNDKIEFRLRTTRTSVNGIPSLATPNRSLSAKLTHIVATHAKSGRTRIYINGKRVAEQQIAGDLSNWDTSFRFGLGNELNGSRPWLGTLQRVAVYSRELSSEDVTKNFTAGAAGKPSPEKIAERRQRQAARYFETAVAPVLARHCLECHDSFHHESGLNLSTKTTALVGGENGRVILPGKAADSPLWAAVESDSMPHERKPLTGAEKDVLKKWINDGATWTLETLDPAIYVHGSENQNWVQRLTVDEYIETVRATMGVDIEQEARDILPPDLRADGFSNTSYNLNVDLKHVVAYAELAEIIVSRMDVEKFVSQYSKKRKFTDDDMGDVVSKLGRWILRGPIAEHELIAFRGITTTVASTGGSYKEAMSYLLQAMLQSPRFIYRVEQQPDNGSKRPVTAHELASRLSYIIWGGPPDQELLKAADEDRLRGPEFDQQVFRMLKDPRAVQQSRRFVTDWLNLPRMRNLRPNTTKFPEWNPQLAADMQQETLEYFEDTVWTQNRPLSALLNSQVTFVTPTLAEFYGLKTPASDPKPHRVDVADNPGRGGLLTHGSVLTVGGDSASMVTRGLLVMHELLRGVVKDPPPCVNTTPVPTKPGLTQRSIAMERIANPGCGGCHEKFEPLAFGLERFNGVGAYSEQDEHGNRLREDGNILFPGATEPVEYKSSKELMNLLANSDRVRQSLTWKVTQFSLGRPLVADDAAIVDTIHRNAQANGGTWPATITAIVHSDLVRLTH